MDSARWKLIQDLFHAAQTLPADQWRTHLESRSRDRELVAYVLEMLARAAEPAPLLDGGVAALAPPLIGAGDTVPPDLGKYQILDRLDPGGMAEVYRAKRTDVGTTVAIKILPDAWVSPDRRDRFAREQKMLAGLSHPAIAHWLDGGTSQNGTPWFAMEFVDGVALTAHCWQRRLPLEQRLRLFRQVCEAVQHAHLNTIVHCDIKPPNILVTANGAVKLLDFGIGKSIADTQGDPLKTRSGWRPLTPAYASPEQLRGAAPHVSTDVYSLGVVLYELLSGCLPFDPVKLSDQALVEQIQTNQFDPPSVAAAKRGTSDGKAVNADRAEWADLDRLCAKAMRGDRTERYQSVEALIRDVDHFLRGEPLEARPNELVYRARKFARRNRRGLAAAAAALGMVVFFVLWLDAARDDALAAAKRAERIRDFTFDLFEADPDTGPGKDLRAITLVDRGVGRAHLLADEPDVQADLYDLLGGIYQRLGDHKKAQAVLASSLAGHERRLGGQHPKTITLSAKLALARLADGQYDEAERLARAALADMKRARDADPVTLAELATVVARVLEERTPAEAIPLLQEALPIYEAHAPESRGLSECLGQLANVHYYLGNFDESRALNLRALALDRKIAGERSLRVSVDLFNLGAIATQRGQHHEAERFYREGLPITEGIYGPEHPRVASNLTMLAQAIRRQGRQGEAKALLDRALVIKERTFGASHAKVAATVNELAQVALAQGRHAEAAAGFRRAADIYREAFRPKKHQFLGIALSNLGDTHLAAQAYGEAEPLLREALAIYRDTVAAGHPDAGKAHQRLGRVLLRLNRPRDAEPESRAGYEILKKRFPATDPDLGKARDDLAEIYVALAQPERAAALRAERPAAPAPLP